jgi:outer membrane protein OmpA-like peptidoglycan-associated protein
MFQWDKAVLDSASLPLLNEVAQTLKENPGFRVQVQGYADSTGAYDYNQSLSERRARAVVDYLVGQGVSRDRLDAKGFSESLPAQSNITTAGREKNRRVEFVVYFIILDTGGAK